MTNNDIIRRLRYTFNYNDAKMIELFELADYSVTRAQISNWLKKDEDPEFKGILDYQLATFLNGIIIDNRGKKDGKLPVVEKKLNNNIVLRKLKIAFNLKDIDIVNIFKLADMRVSKSEISAFFRNPVKSQFRPCKDQFLRNFLIGLQMKFRQ